MVPSLTGYRVLSRMCLQEHETRFSTWKDNLKYILDYNGEHTSHKVSSLFPESMLELDLQPSWSDYGAVLQLGLNRFADQTFEEFSTTHLGLLPEAANRYALIFCSRRVLHVSIIMAAFVSCMLPNMPWVWKARSCVGI